MDNMIVNIENPMESERKTNKYNSEKLMQEFSKFAGYKINT